MTDEQDLPRPDSGAGISLGARTRELLRRHDLRPRKSLGQNFLLNGGKVQRIAEAALAAAEAAGVEQVLEIGPGLGALTRPLAASGKRIVACEIDEHLRPALAEALSDLPNVSVVWQDVLRVDLAAIMGGEAYIAAGNLPYQITSPLLELLLNDPACRALVITIQKEVGDRMAAAPGGKDYGPLSLFCQYHVGSIETIVRLAPGDFLPPPRIDSVALKLVKREQPPFAAPGAAQFIRTVRAAFNHRRKSLLAGLALTPQLGMTRAQVAPALEGAGLDGQRRAETLSMEELARLALALERVEQA